MKNKKGFTLIELLAVIAVLGLIISVAMPSIMRAVRKTDKNLCKNKSELILSAAEIYAQDNPSTTVVSVSKLLEIGTKYLDADEKDTDKCPIETYTYGCMINPLDNSVINTKNINITYVGNRTYKAVWENENGICGEQNEE